MWTYFITGLRGLPFNERLIISYLYSRRKRYSLGRLAKFVRLHHRTVKRAARSSEIVKFENGRYWVDALPANYKYNCNSKPTGFKLYNFGRTRIQDAILSLVLSREFTNIKNFAAILGCHRDSVRRNLAKLREAELLDCQNHPTQNLKIPEKAKPAAPVSKPETNPVTKPETKSMVRVGFEVHILPQLQNFGYDPEEIEKVWFALATKASVPFIGHVADALSEWNREHARNGVAGNSVKLVLWKLKQLFPDKLPVKPIAAHPNAELLEVLSRDWLVDEVEGQEWIATYGADRIAEIVKFPPTVPLHKRKNHLQEFLKLGQMSSNT